MVTVGLIFGSHRLLKKARNKPEDPNFVVIQGAVIIGGVISVVLAYVVGDGVVGGRELFYSAAVMATFAFVSFGLEQMRKSGAHRKAVKAWEDAISAKHMADCGELSDARDGLQEALLTTELAYGSTHPQVAAIVMNLAQVMVELNRPVPARTLLGRAVAIYGRLGFAPKGAVEAVQKYALHLLGMNQLKEALVQAEQAVVQGRRIHGASAVTGRSYHVLSQVQEAAEKIEEAYQSSKQAVSLLEKALDKAHPRTLQAKSLLAHQGVVLGRVAEGERIVREVIAAKERTRKTQDEEYLGLLLDRLALERRAGNVQAAGTYQRALEVFREWVGADYSRAEELLSHLADFLSADGPPEFRPFYEALVADKSMAAREELQKHSGLLDHRDRSGWTPLQWAIFLGRRDLAERLLSLGADHTVGEGVGQPPLFLAARWKRKALIAALFRKDADIEIECADGSRPMHGAVRSGDPFTYDTVSSRGAKVDVPNKRGWTALHEAAFVGDRKLLIQIYTKGADINFQGGTHREAPIHAAILGGHRSTTESLVLNGADLTLKDNDGFTPLELAESLDKPGLADLIRSNLSEGEEGAGVAVTRTPDVGEDNSGESEDQVPAGASP